MTEFYRIGWEKLFELTGLSITELLDEIHSLGIDVCLSNFVLWRQYGTIPPEYLVRICNHFRYSITNFSRVAGRELDGATYRLHSENEWQDIELMPGNIITYATNNGRRKRDDAMQKIGCSAGYYDAFRKYPSTPLPQKLTYAGLLNYINNAGMYPGDVILDPNELFQLEYNVRPFFNHKALEAYHQQYPTPQTTFVAEDIIDIRDFLIKYFTKGPAIKDDRIVGVKLSELNEMAGMIASLRRESDDLRMCNRQVEEENSRLKASLKPSNS